MSARAVASLLVSIVVVAPCMRKNICVPAEPGAPAPAKQQQSQPAPAVKPASVPSESRHPCPNHDMHAKTSALNAAGRSS